MVLIATVFIHQTLMSETNTTHSPSMSNPLTSDGQLKEFPYNPQEASAHFDLIQIMGTSQGISRKNQSQLPYLPDANHTVRPFMEPQSTQSSISLVFNQPPLPNAPANVTTSKLTAKLNDSASETIMLPMVPYMGHSSITPEMQVQFSFLKITDTELQCYISPPISNMLNMEDVREFTSEDFDLIYLSIYALMHLF